MRLTTLLPHLTGTRKLYVALCGDQIFLNGWTTITALVAFPPGRAAAQVLWKSH